MDNQSPIFEKNKPISKNGNVFFSHPPHMVNYFFGGVEIFWFDVDPKGNFVCGLYTPENLHFEPKN